MSHVLVLFNVAEAETWATPVLLPDGVVVRDAAGVTRLRFAPPGR